LIPALSADVLKLAVFPVMAIVPSAVVPRRNVTVPVGVPYEKLTVVVKVTGWPKFEGFKFDVTFVEVGNAFTF